MYGIKKWWYDAHRHAVHTTQRQDQMAEILPLCSPLHLRRLGTTSGCIRTFFVRVRFRILLPLKGLGRKLHLHRALQDFPIFTCFGVGNHLATSASKHYL